MTMTYATITGRITQPGTDIGVRVKVTASPMTTNKTLKFAADQRITVGPQTAETDVGGNLTALKIPLNSDTAGVVWRFTAEPLDRIPGLSAWTLGTFPITASANLASLVSVDIVTVTPDVIQSVSTYATAASSSKDAAASSASAAAGSATSAQGWATAASSSAADAATDADLADAARTDAQAFASGFSGGTATSLAPGAAPTVSVTGTAPNRKINVGIPAGQADDASMTAVATNASSAFASALSASIGENVDPVRAGDTYVTNRPILTFVTDDGNPLFYDIMGALATEKNFKLSLAAIGASVTGDPTSSAQYPSMTLAQLKALEASGHDVLSHGWVHYATYDAAVTPAMLDSDYAQMSAWMKANFPKTADIHVYPGGLDKTDEVKKGIARKYFRYGITTSSSWTVPPVDNWAVQRINGDSLTEAQIKAFIDGAVANNAWLVIMNHDKELDTTLGGRAPQMDKLRNIIDYARTSGMEILPFTEAEKVKGNAIAIGAYTDQANSTFVARNGRQRWGGAQGTWTPALVGTTIPGAHVYVSRKGYYQVAGGICTAKFSISIAAGTAAAINGSTAAVNIGTSGTLTLSLSGSQFATSLVAGDTPASVVSKLNTQYGTAMVASLNGGILRLTTGATGPACTITVVSGTGSVLADLGLTASQSATGGGGLDSLMTGNLRITGLPLLMSPNEPSGSGPLGYNYLTLGTNYTSARAKAAIVSNATVLNLLKDGNGVAEAFLATSAAVAAGQTCNLEATVQYMVPNPPVW